MAGHSTGTYLNTRCAISTFKKLAEPLLNVLADESNDVLTDAGILQYFLIPDLPQNIPLLYRLCRLYRPDKRAFLLGNYYVKMTVNEVALIIGLPNRGEEFDFKRLPFSNQNHRQLMTEMMELAAAESNPQVEARRLNFLVKYVLCKFFFPLKSLRIPVCLLDFGGIEEFKRMNWPLAIHKFMHSQFEALHKIASCREDPASLGYLEGCSIILVVWFFEHSNMQVPVNDMFRPRIGRWASKGSFSQKFCTTLTSRLAQKDQVRTSFSEYSIEEHGLVGVEADESSFESFRKTRRRRKEFVEDEDSSFEKPRKVHKEKKVETNTDDLLRKYIRSEIKSAREKLSKENRQMYSKLHSYCEARFDRLESLLEPAHIHIPVQSPPHSPLPRPVDHANVVCVDDSTPVSKLRKRKHVSSVSAGDAPLQFKFPGRHHLSKKAAQRIDSILRPSSCGDSIFQNGNIDMTRGALIDLLGEGWLSDVHLDAFAAILNYRRNSSPNSCKTFLYVSPNYALYKTCAITTHHLISHITADNVKVAEFILMPVHLGVHWALLVGNLREQSWCFYDSMPNSRHRTNLSSLIAGLHESNREALPDGIMEWPILPDNSAPTQENGHDCGMFVVKYMEAITSTKNISWEDCRDWQKKMPKYRALLAYEMVKIFCDG